MIQQEAALSGGAGSMAQEEHQPKELKMDEHKGEELVSLADQLGITDKKVTSELRVKQKAKKLRESNLV